MEMTLSVSAAQMVFVEILVQRDQKEKKETEEEMDEEDGRETLGSQG